MPSTKLTRAYGSGVTGNRNKWTISGWYKLDKGAASSGERTMLGVYSNGSYFTSLAFLDDGRINFMDFYNGGLNGRIRTNALHRDTNGWYHVVGVFDKDNSTSGDKMRLWVNGVRITGSLAQYETMPSQASTINSDSQTLEIGTLNNTSHFGGIMSHLHFCDGYAYDASYFGSTDSTTGEWKINTSPSVSYGTQGWFWLKDTNATTDNSPNSNTFTVGSGTLTKTEDNPSNVFATWNPLSPNDSITYSYGNGVVTGSNPTNYSMSCSTTLGASSGKYYWEMKYSTVGNGNECIGVANFDNYEYNVNMTQGTTGYVSLRWDGEREINGATTSNYFTPPSTGAVLMCAMDMDNGKVFFGSNGTWFGSGNPVTGANPTADILTSGTWGGILRYLNSKWECNFGNGYFADNTVSSAGTNASGNGIFEYDVPTGYTALSTKGLNL